jgi:hypothetical protein
MNYSFTLLTSSMTIGDALSAMNNNSLLLDEWFNTIQLSSVNFWNPFVTFYKNTYLEWDSRINLANQNLQNWKDMSTLIETNSSKWIEPIVLFYPKLVNINTNNIQSTILNWLNTNYTIYENGKVNYIENQIVQIYCMITDKAVRADITRNGTAGTPLYSSTTCRTADSSVCAGCSISFSGKVDCDNGDFECGGSTSCTVCKPYPCNYIDPLTKQTVKSYSPYIQANLTYSFTDTYENNLKPFTFKVKNCKWEYVNVLI